MILKDNSTHGYGRISMTQAHMVNSGRTSYTLPNLQRDNIVAVTHNLDGRDTAGIDHAKEGIVDQHALNDHMNDINDFSWVENEIRTSFIGLFLGFACELLIG